MIRSINFPITVGPNSKSTECYLGLLYALEDVAVYGYITPLKVKIILTFDLTDAVVAMQMLPWYVYSMCFTGHVTLNFNRYSVHSTWRTINRWLTLFCVWTHLLIQSPITRHYWYKAPDDGKASVDV